MGVVLLPFPSYEGRDASELTSKILLEFNFYQFKNFRLACFFGARARFFGGASRQVRPHCCASIMNSSSSSSATRSQSCKSHERKSAKRTTTTTKGSPANSFARAQLRKSERRRVLAAGFRRCSRVRANAKAASPFTLCGIIRATRARLMVCAVASHWRRRAQSI